MPEMPKTQNLLKIDLGDGLYIECDQDDTWVAVGDEDWVGYDRGGAVVMSVEKIDVLIEQLRQVKALLGAGGAG